MSLGLWEFFWTESDWTGAPAPSPSPSPSPSPPPAPATEMPGPDLNPAGGGHNDSDPAPPRDLWEVREKYLRSLWDQVARKAPSPIDYDADYTEYNRRQAELEQAASDRAAAIIALRKAGDVATMKAIGARIKELNAKIAKLEGKQAFQRFMKR